MSDLSITNDNFSFNKEEVRALVSVKYWSLRSASNSSTLPKRQELRHIIRGEFDSKNQAKYKALKKKWCDEWKAITCKLLELEDIFAEAQTNAKIKQLKFSTAKASAFSIEALTFEPFHPLWEGDERFKSLRTDGQDKINYLRQIASYSGLRSVWQLEDMKRDFSTCINTIVKSINRANDTWLWVGLGTLALLLIAPFAAGLIGGAMGLSGAAATSAGLAFLGGGSLAAGGMGMAGGYVVLMAGGAILGYGGGTKQQRDKFKEVSKEEILVNCAKLHAIRSDLDISKREVCKNVLLMQADLESLADDLFCKGQKQEGHRQAEKAIVLATYRRIARGELDV